MPKIIGRPKVRFNLFDWRAEEETYIILFYAYRKGQRFQHSVGAKIHPDDWDRKKQRAKPGKVFPDSEKFPDSAELKKHLDKLVKYCEDIYDLHNKGRISTADFKQELKRRLEENAPPEEKTPITFLEFVERAYKEKAASPTAKKGSLQVDHKVMTHLQNYAREKHHKLGFSELNKTLYTDFKSWLHSPPRSLSTNYVQKIFQNLKYYIKEAYSQSLHNNREYMTFNPPKAPVTKIILSFEQLAALADLDFSKAPHLEKTRDLFLIGAYSGLRYSDFSRIRPERITEHQGEKIIELITQKTEQTVFIPLHPVLDGILKKYGYTSPKMSNQKMNAYLKEVGKVAGLTKEIMVFNSKGGRHTQNAVPMWELLKTHVARRSFASNYYHAHPELIDNIMRITGHTTEKMFRAYIVSDAKDSALKFAKGIKSI